MKKKILIAVGIVVVVVVAGVAILVTNLDRVVESKREYILSQAEASLGRKVTVGDIGVGVWPGIGVSLTDVTLADDAAFAEEPFVRVADLRVNVKLLPLLRKQVEVKRLVLTDPMVTVIVDADGRHNFDSMVEKGAAESGAAGGDDAKAGAGAAALVLAYADVENGTVRFVDRGRGIDHTVGSIHFTARDVSLDSEISFEISAALLSSDTDVKVEGKLGPLGEFKKPADLSGVPIDVDVSLGPIDGARAAALVPVSEGKDAPPVDKLGLGAVEGKLSIRGTLGALSVEDLVARAAVLGAKDANIELKAGVTGINALAVGGAAEAKTAGPVNVTGEVRIGPLPLAALAALQPAPKAGASSSPPPELGGEVSAAVSFQGTPEHMTIDGSLDGDAATVTAGESFRKPAGTPMRASIRGAYRAPVFEVGELEVRFADLLLHGSGVLGAEAFDLSFNSDVSDVTKWTSMLPALAPIKPTGKFRVRVNVAGTPGSQTPPRVAGTLTLEGGGATLAQLPSPVHDAAATVSFTKTTAKIEKATVTVGRSVIAAAVDVSSIEPLKASYRVTSERVYRDDVQAPVGGKPAPRPEVLDKIVAEGNVWRDTPERVDHKGTVKSASGVIANLDYANLSAETRSDGDAIVIESYSAQLLDGTVSGSGRIEPLSVPPRFDITTKVQNVDLARYIAQTAPGLGKLIEGRIDLNLNVSGAGKEWQEIASTLSGRGNAVVIKGALLNFNLANELLAGLQTVPLVPSGFAERVRTRNPKLFSSSATVFEDLKGNLDIDAGRVNAKGLVLKAADFSISGDGWFSFEKNMNLNSTVVFSQKLTDDVVAELPIAKYLRNADGRISLPLTLTGDLLSPKFGLDTNALASTFQRSALDEGKGKLEGQLKEGVKDLLGGFGKKKDSGAKADTTGTRKTP